MEHGRAENIHAVEDRYSGFTVYDNAGAKIGSVDDLFVDENDRPEYVGVKMGFLGITSSLIPWEIVTTDEVSGRLTVASEREHVLKGPAFGDDREITPEFEELVRSHFGLIEGEASPRPPDGDGLDRLLDSWIADESGYDEGTWPDLKGALDRNRAESGDRRRLFFD
jgi:hypothetical protein